MYKKAISLLLTAIMMLSICGCSAVFSNSYRSEHDFQGNDKITLDADVQVVQNYSELRRHIFGMVNNHTETKELLFSGYTGNVVSDIASVCNAVKTESSYGAYCVDYISYDLRQIVSSYEAGIHISYLYTIEELQILQTTSNLESFADLLVTALENEDSKLLVRVNNGTADSEAVQSLIQQTARNHPLSISYMPTFTVRVFDGNTSQKIYDVAIQYDNQVDNASRLSEMNDVLDRVISELKYDTIEKNIAMAAVSFRDLCDYVPDAESTAYQAVLGMPADSQSIACAYKALCDRMNVECMIVVGQMGKQPHCWNIVKIEDAYYHVDVSSLILGDDESDVFMSDSEKQVNCWWNQAEYPECIGMLSYDSMVLFE